MCVDSMGHKNGNGAMEYGHCHRMGGNQLFRLNSANQLAQYDQCVATVRGMITLVHCDTTQYKEWKHVSILFSLLVDVISKLRIFIVINGISYKRNKCGASNQPVIMSPITIRLRQKLRPQPTFCT